MSKRGRHTHDRLRAMRFALWAQHVPIRALTINQISGLLDIDRSTASKWRTDFIHAISPVEVDGIPPFLTPHYRVKDVL